jgi:hypothetical protein
VSIKALANYSSTTDERWRFEQFGNSVVAVNINDNPQDFTIGSSTEFADLAGTPPRARYIKAWGSFLALMNLSGSLENRVHWSGLENRTQWTPGVNSCDFQDFPDGGNVQGSSSATNPFILLKRAIYAGTFIPGSTSVFSFTKIHDKRGAAAPYSIASRGNLTFFADSGGLFQLNADGSIAPIGFEKIDRTIFSQISGPNLAGILGEIDPFFNRYYLAVKISSTTNYDRLVIYDWGIGEFTQQSDSVGILFPLGSGTLGYTLEGSERSFGEHRRAGLLAGFEGLAGRGPCDGGDRRQQQARLLQRGQFRGDDHHAGVRRHGRTTDAHHRDRARRRHADALRVDRGSKAALGNGRSGLHGGGAALDEYGRRPQAEPGAVHAHQGPDTGQHGVDEGAGRQPQRRAGGDAVRVELTSDWSPEQFAPYGEAVTAAMRKLAQRFPREVTVPHLVAGDHERPPAALAHPRR